MDTGPQGHQDRRGDADPGALRRSSRFALAVALVLLPGCATVAAISNVGEPACGDELERATASILVAEGETSENAGALAARTRDVLASGNLGPRPFTLAAPSGVDYGFFVDLDDGTCVLRLFGTQKGFTSYTNNLTYIASRPLPGCRCAE